MIANPRIFLTLLILVAVFFAGFGTRSYIAGKDQLRATVDHQAKLLEASNEFASKVRERDEKIQKLNGKLATLEQEKIKALNEELTENSRLRADLAVAQRMRFQGAICPQGPTTGAAGSSSSLGDAEGAELTPEARQDVWDLREGIIQLEGKLDYLQSYIERLGLWPPPADVE